jgi:farnesyl diphosphate synthase/geranylgeranyl diphosphate synthase type II
MPDVRDSAVVDISADRSEIDATLGQLCEALLAGLPGRIREAIRYSVRGAGKRLRGLLVMYAYRAAGGTANPAAIAAAVEVIHAYSLVHDDLPCMDDDDMRRGRPTTHILYGPETASVAGAAMIPFAALCVIDGAKAIALEDTQAAIIVEALMQAAGAAGMIGGQLRDLRAEGEQVTLETLESVHRAKTGALIAASARIGGLAAGADDAALDALGRYGADLGLAFQIIDDVLDVTATTDQLGKTAGRDLVLNKSTYPAQLGVSGAIDRAHRMVRDGCAVLSGAGLLTPELRYIADLVITRTH